MDERARELLLREREYQAELKKLKEAGVADLTAFEAEYRNDLLEINKKYDDAELAREQEKIRKEQELKKKQEEEDKRKAEEKLAADSEARQNELAFLEADFNFRQQLGELTY